MTASFARPLMTVRDVREASQRGERQLAAPLGALLTPLARDTAREFHAEIISKSPTEVPRKARGESLGHSTAAMGSDSFGPPGQEGIVTLLKDLGYSVLTLGVQFVDSALLHEILRLWLETWSAGGSHQRLLETI